MSAATLLPRESGDDHALRELEEVAELESLRQVAVEDLALVLDVDACVTLAQAGDDLALPLHLFLAPEDAEVLVHRRRELVADLPRALARLALEQGVELSLGVALDGLGHLDRRVRQRPFSCVPARALAERDGLHQGVPAETVGAVDRDAGDLPGGVQPL